ncbi:MAG: DUF1223 domain-containing protein [Acidobacteria bacterium]|nr:DUF1223 domain-containing protein [Acidobacteriota bacterium]
MKTLFLLFLAAALATGPAATDPVPPSTGKPVLIELFTSEGCSSCPPADRLLERFDHQPIAGAELIVLSEHVDYWDHIGWKDPYSSALYSNRQKAYGDRFRLESVYTPQMVVDGNSEFVGNDAARANQAIAASLRTPKLHLALTLLRSQDGPRLQIETGTLEPSFGIREADVYVAYALNHAESQVSGGENSGHKLTHVSVVTRLNRIGEIRQGQQFSQQLVLNPAAGFDARNGRVVVFVQQRRQGGIVGAAVVTIPQT